MKFVDDFVDYCQEFTGCPEIFLRWSAMVALSSVAGSKHVLRRGDWDVRPNLWILIVGNSSSYKSTGLASARRLLYEAARGVIAAQDGSYEAIIEDLALNPHRVFIYDEAESYFKMLAQKYNAPLAPAMMSLYNGQPISRRIKGKDGKGEFHDVQNAYVGWAGASTPVQIASRLNGSTTDILSGMFPRFLLVPYFGKERSIDDPPPADKDKASLLIDRLKFLASIGEREYHYAPNALKAKSQWLADFNKRAESSEVLLAAFYRKMRDEHFHKIAMLAAFERNSSEISLQDVAETSKLLWPIEKEWAPLVERFTEKEWDRDAKRVVDFLKSRGKVSRSELLQGVRGIRAQKLSAILDGLEQDNLVKVVTDKKADKPSSLITWL